MNLEHFDTILAFAAVMAGLSLVITALTQAISGLLGLRGLNLKWGLIKLFATLAPQLDEIMAQTLARHILLHPLLSDSTFAARKIGWTWWRYASHIRPEELTGLLSRWRTALAMPQTTAQEKAARTKVLDSLNVPGSFRELATTELAKLQGIEDGLAEWFESSMSRVSQRFSANMRLITILGAGIVSLVLLVDSIELWQQLARSPELRLRVIATSDALLKKADEMQAGSTNLPAAVYRVAAGQLLALHTNELAKFSGIAAITDLRSGTNWLIAQCQANGVTNSARWLEEYQALVPQAALRQSADHLHSLVESHLALGVIHSRLPGESWSRAVGRHWGGVMVSIAMLSLGAPFWFNLLRSLSNLRPVLANKDAEAQQARVKAIAAGNQAPTNP